MSYTTIQDYINFNLTDLGDIDLTDDQKLEIAHEMTEWENGQLVERTDLDFWDVVAATLGD